MLTLVAFPLALLLVAVLLGLLFAILSKRPHPYDRLSISGAFEARPSLRRSAVSGDEARLQRMIAYERRLNPLASETEVELRAYTRMRRTRRYN